MAGTRSCDGRTGVLAASPARGQNPRLARRKTVSQIGGNFAAMPDAPSRFSGLTPLLSPRSVAVLGASSDPTRIGGRPIAYHEGARVSRARSIRSIRTAAEVQGLKAYPSVAALPETPDVAIVAVPAEIAAQAVDGPGGTRREGGGDVHRRLRRRWTKPARQRRPTWSPIARGARHAHPRAELPGRVRRAHVRITRRSPRRSTAAGRCRDASASPSQSGAYGTHLYTLARNRGIGASLCIMTGNEADVTVGECIGWLAENPEVDVIAVYAEGIREAHGPDRRAGSRARGEEAGHHAEGRAQRTRRQGGEVAHRLDRRRRCGDRGGDGANSA